MRQMEAIYIKQPRYKTTIEVRSSGQNSQISYSRPPLKKRYSPEISPRFYILRPIIALFSKKKVFASDQPHVSVISF